MQQHNIQYTTFIKLNVTKINIFNGGEIRNDEEGATVRVSLASRMITINLARRRRRLIAANHQWRDDATPCYKWRAKKQLFMSPLARHLAERGRDRARVGDDVDVGYAVARRRVDEE